MNDSNLDVYSQVYLHTPIVQPTDYTHPLQMTHGDGCVYIYIYIYYNLNVIATHSRHSFHNGCLTIQQLHFEYRSRLLLLPRSTTDL